MPVSITRVVDAIYLGDFGLVEGAGGSAARGAVATSYSTFGNGGGGFEATVQQLTVSGQDQQNTTTTSTTDFRVRPDGELGHDIDPGTGALDMVYSDFVTVNFVTTTGSFNARMTLFQLSDGSVYLVEDPTAVGLQRFSSLMGSGEVTSFTVGTLDSGSQTAATFPELDWAGSSFPICFVAGTMIMTDAGEVAVETLKQGDLVMTMDNGLQEVRWIGVQTMSAAALNAAKNLRPVRIKAGALGDGMPQSDLLVSQQHRMLVRSAIAQKMFGEDEVLVAAKHLVLLDGVDIVDDADGVTYVHFLCAQHEVVFANGAPSETLYTGPEALKTVSPAARAEILAIFPEVADIDYKALMARKAINGRMGRQLAVRHKNKGTPLLDLH